MQARRIVKTGVVSFWAVALSAGMALAAGGDDILKYCEPDIGIDDPTDTVVIDCIMDEEGRIACDECPEGFTALFIDLPAATTVDIASGSPS